MRPLEEGGGIHWSFSQHTEDNVQLLSMHTPLCTSLDQPQAAGDISQPQGTQNLQHAQRLQMKVFSSREKGSVESPAYHNSVQERDRVNY